MTTQSLRTPTDAEAARSYLNWQDGLEKWIAKMERNAKPDTFPMGNEAMQLRAALEILESVRHRVVALGKTETKPPATGKGE